MSTMSNKNSKIFYDICYNLTIERKKIKTQQHSLFFLEFRIFANNLKLYTTKTNVKIDKQFTSVFLYDKKIAF